jgi:hypothetical protein
MPVMRRMINRIPATSFVAIAAVGFIAPLANADDVPGSLPNFLMTWDASGDVQGPDTYDPTIHQTQQTQWGTWEVGGDSWTGWRYIGGITNEFWTLTWDCIVNDDPFVVATINVQNTSGATQNFSNFMNLGIAGTYDPTLMNGSVSAGLTNGSPLTTGATLSAGADPIYQAFIDPGANPPAASAARTIWNSGYSLSASQLQGSASDNAAFANEIGPGAFTSIGLKLQFNLTPGDSASVSGIFQIEQVPGPASLAVFAIFGAISGGRRRRS